MKVPCAVVKNIKEVLEQDKAQRLIKTEKKLKVKIHLESRVLVLSCIEK